MTDTTADLDTEVRRLRVRIIGLTMRQLDEAVETSTGPRTRRQAIRASLDEFSALGSEGRTVPELGDRSLADQVVVIIAEGRERAAGLPRIAGDELAASLNDAATRLRRTLA